MNDVPPARKARKEDSGDGCRYRGLVQKGKHRGMHRYEAYFYHPPGKKVCKCFFLNRKLVRQAEARAKQIEVDYVRAHPDVACPTEDTHKIPFKNLRAKVSEIMASGKCRPRTIRRAMNTFDHFCEFLQKNHPEIQTMGEFTRGIYDRYQRFVWSDLNRPEGWYSEAGTLRAIMKRLYDDHYCEYKSIEELMRIRLTKPQPKHYIHVDREEKRKLYEYAKKDRPEYSAVLYFLMRHGLRIGELLSIKPSDVYFDECRIEPEYIKIEGTDRKNKYYHIIHLVPDTAGIVKGLFDPKRKWLFMDTPGTPHTRSNHFYNYIVKISQQVLGKRLHSHYFRHNATTTMHKAGVPNKDGMQVTGHRDESVYARHYQHATNDGIIKAMKATEF